MPDLPLLVDPVLAGSRLPLAVSDPGRPDNPLIFVNSAFQLLTGYPEEQLLGRNCRWLQGAEPAGVEEEAARRVGAALAARRPVVETLVNFRSDGTVFHNLLSVSPVSDWLGERTYFVATAKDVSARVR